ncbi:hypothetical protein [Bacillus thuringiensis]|uniref:hypothetical protein n=1 Tax=Bacillus thuringiensis TaxID=1428 RepID=UPI000BFCF3DB|nr:hypothetical protein [Bacillus thuringiensis]PGW40330.1 hypothetical protein COE03_26440 [Bacillus thuringiensis]
MDLFGIFMMSTSLFGNISVAFAQEKETPYATQYKFTMNNSNQYNGLRVKEVGNSTIYLIDNRTKRRSTSPEVYRRVFRNGNIGLVKFENNPKVYLLDKNIHGKTVKRWITSPTAIDKYNFRWDMPIIPAWNIYSFLKNQEIIFTKPGKKCPVFLRT